MRFVTVNTPEAQKHQSRMRAELRCFFTHFDCVTSYAALKVRTNLCRTENHPGSSIQMAQPFLAELHDDHMPFGQGSDQQQPFRFELFCVRIVL